ncbi:hypothetical protein GCM10010912_52060 [Paenibacillus albidus]|uniref:Uncharacterized protein n=1 Tax=Paenibacillus albidus TaxID=2041023 RepID=A0A917CWY9_9BACL|nr:hypothetical protein [Paenibacillus albidus]GGG00816.1 hypothetical protein GCM10010912_52060 [Paenibacillus albidus]
MATLDRGGKCWIALFGYSVFTYFKSEDLIKDNIIFALLKGTFVVRVLINSIKPRTSSCITGIVPIGVGLGVIVGVGSGELVETGVAVGVGVGSGVGVAAEAGSAAVDGEGSEDLI